MSSRSGLRPKAPTRLLLRRTVECTCRRPCCAIGHYEEEFVKFGRGDCTALFTTQSSALSHFYNRTIIVARRGRTSVWWLLSAHASYTPWAMCVYCRIITDSYVHDFLARWRLSGCGRTKKMIGFEEGVR